MAMSQSYCVILTKKRRMVVLQVLFFKVVQIQVITRGTSRITLGIIRITVGVTCITSFTSITLGIMCYNYYK